ncbi:ATP-binding protein [Pedobacter frigidisoli]|uniref:ATP-binding protein n=1 Tax=Pedobacter frigidisoli TaxID=2530455 RepID=UPI0029309872|nr:ATP-binding protein [Pedobacter frigidisoli]
MIEVNALDLCSREAIHVPGHIQAHGYLLILNSVGIVKYSSENFQALTRQVLGIEVLESYVTNLSPIFGKAENHKFIEYIINLSWQGNEFKPLNPYMVEIKGNPYNMILSLSGEDYILDFEPEASDLFTDPQNKVGAALSQMLASKSLQTILENTVFEIQRIIGYNRIMIYKFHDDGHGEVIAEEKRSDLETWLGLHYPASDIPKQARDLYKKNYTRLIANVQDKPVPILSVTNLPADLTNSTIRAVSPIHITYLKNMGVESSFSVSIIVDDELWGLIACHNYSPRFINFRQREAAKLIGQVLSSCIETRSQEKLHQDNSKLQSIVSEITRSLSNRKRIQDFIEDCGETILNAFKASGISLFFQGASYSLGEVPDDEDILLLAAELDQRDSNSIKSYNLSHDIPAINLDSNKFAGLLGCLLMEDVKDCLLIFRSEVSHTVKWAGDPKKIIQFDEHGNQYISPRNSFAQWSQEVKGKSEVWSGTEVEILFEIRDEINFAIGRKSLELRVLNEKLRDAYSELDAFAHTVSHDLKTPLTAIKSYGQLIERRSSQEEIRKMSAKIVANSVRLNEMIHTVLEYSRAGQKLLKTVKVDMTSLIAEIKEQVLVGIVNKNLALNILSTPDIDGDPILIFQVFLNLIENAVKYSHKKNLPIVSISGAIENDSIVYRIKDNGVGISEEEQSKIFGLFSRVGNQEEYEGTGVGLATVKKIINRHGATIKTESEVGNGCTFILSFPLAG